MRERAGASLQGSTKYEPCTYAQWAGSHEPYSGLADEAPREDFCSPTGPEFGLPIVTLSLRHGTWLTNRGRSEGPAAYVPVSLPHRPRGWTV
jgi:hypothetical protein